MGIHVETIWAAGLFEGEGSIEEEISDRDPRPRLQLKMVSEASVRRFHAAVETGTVYGPYGPYPSAHAKNPYWLWVAHGAQCQLVAALIGPFTSEPWRSRLASIS